MEIVFIQGEAFGFVEGTQEAHLVILNRVRKAFFRRFDVAMTSCFSAEVLKYFNRKEWPRIRIYDSETSS